MSEGAVYRALEQPWLYRLSQALLAPGAEKALTDKFARIVERFPRGERILDVGCGPQSWLWMLGLRPTGLDLSPVYAAKFKQHGETAITGSATHLPFADHSFDAVWSIGVLHHMTDGMVRQAVSEMVRVCSASGYVVVFDAVLPEPAWRHPVAWLLRRLDRGRNMRRQQTLESLLINRADWLCERIQYSLLGHEGLVCVRFKN